MSEHQRSLGIVTPPGYPKELSQTINKQLPEMLKYYVKDDCEWQVETLIDPLTGVTEDPEEVFEAGLKKRDEENWDYIVCLTDLPFFHDRKPIMAEASTNDGVAIITLPGLGSTPMLKRVRQSILQLVNEMYYGSDEEDREKAQERLQSQEDGEHENLKKKGSRRLVEKRGIDRFSPIKRVTPDEDDDTYMDVRFIVQSRISGALRVLTGMVRANRPWAIFPAFMKVIIFAFATGSYALVFPTLWRLSNNYSSWRMLLLTVLSISLMVGWIILAHNLWEKPREDRAPYLRKLYNMTTLLTLGVTVVIYYSILFVMFSAAVLVFIPMGLLESEVSGAVGYDNYFYIAWTATSISIIIGALGSALENEEVVLSSTYGYRQQQRYKTANEEEQDETKKAQQDETKKQREKNDKQEVSPEKKRPSNEDQEKAAQ
ncbi:hypothetical protein GLW04_09870 [Halobacillus litoralis]|uniref:5,10-methylene-tetrahydrofolate dehydrogenase n=1 Tax=Halobacillus litoralis TaxID=45668 RepID=A0A845DRM5_9BACI|nr:hypothetical protein [Halobacillus litoralis]MYL20193.1 hypothetical protein [Halobacillus litoralis]